MEEFFDNDFVVRVESGHPGYVNYQIIATPESWRSFAAQLAAAVERCERTEESKENRSLWQNGEFPLISKRATVSKGQSSRVSISLAAAKDLDIHHVRPTRWKSFQGYVSCLLIILAILGMLYLAGVGVSTFHWFY